MIATSAAVLDLLQGATRKTHWRLLIEDADGTMRDYSDQGGVDWRESAEWGKTVDSVMADGVVALASKVGDLSLAPMVEGSSLNRDAADAFAPAIDMGRALEVWVQVTDVGAPAVEADWVLIYDAIIQKVDWARTVRLSTLDRSSLLNKIIRTEATYGTPGGTAVETVMQQMIDDNLGAGVFTLAVPTSPGFMVTEYPHRDATLVGKSVREALDDLSAAFAGYVDYRDDLTLIVPDRTEPTAGSAVATIGPEHYKAIPRLDVDLDGIRNVVRITFRSTATGEIEFVEVTHAGSIAAYGEHFIGITEGDTSPIDTTPEATDMANDILSDLAVQRVQQQVQDWFFYPVELGDHITWKANGKHYDTDQHWAVTGFRHRLSRDKRETTFDVRGAASGGYRRWIRRAGSVGGIGDLPDQQDIAFKSTTLAISGTNVIADIVLQVVDPAGASGTLSLWTNKASTADPDPTGAADQTLTVAAGQTVGPASAAADVTATSLDDVIVASLSRPGNRKVIYARWDSIDGRTTGIKAMPLSRGLLTLDEVDPTTHTGNKPKKGASDFEFQDAAFIIDTETLNVGTAASPSSLTKEIIFQAASVMPANETTNWDVAPGYLHNGAGSGGSEMIYYVPVLLPVGVTMTELEARLYRNSVSEAASANLLRAEDTGATTSLASVAHATTGWANLTASLSETVDGTKRYVIEIRLTYGAASAAIAARFAEARISYTMPSYDKGL